MCPQIQFPFKQYLLNKTLTRYCNNNNDDDKNNNNDNNNNNKNNNINNTELTAAVAQWLERSPREREVVGSIPDRVIPKTL